MDGALVSTTVGRIIFNEVLPPKLRFMDRVMDNKEMGKVVRECYENYGASRTVQLVDELKELGFRYATIAGDHHLHVRHGRARAPAVRRSSPARKRKSPRSTTTSPRV